MTDLLPVIETARLRLRAPALSDAQDMSSYMTPAITRWLASWPYPLSLDEAMRRIEHSRAKIEAGGFAFYALVRRSDGRMIGGFSGGVDPQDPRRLAISYHLAESAHGQGLMSEAADAIVPVLWRMFPAEVIEAGAQLDNAASFKVMEALGMTPQGERLVYSSSRDRQEPTMFYAMHRPGNRG
jgi:RimJ/RimL family protein N-acetyltransferase